MKIDIDYIADLSYIYLDEDKREKLNRDMEQIISMVEKMPNIGIDDENLDENYKMDFRKDEIEPSLTRDEALLNAKRVKAGCVLVPKTLD
ncbi:MAG: Asp-tRNA(Asn)/Glu-tRNA(Gln) amidotransferase subunit GatC [Oscillospiraceae bacterium]